jgi:hypothetical protein
MMSRLVPRHERVRFLLVAAPVAVATLVAGVFLADPLVATARPIVRVLVLLLGLADSVGDHPASGWMLRENWTVPSIGAETSFDMQLEDPTLRMMLRGYPVFLALMCAPPWSPRDLVRTMTGVGVLYLLFLASIVFVVFNLHVMAKAEIVNQLALRFPAFSNQAVGPPSWVRSVSGLLASMGYIVIPYLAPAVLWVVLKPEGWRLLAGPVKTGT